MLGDASLFSLPSKLKKTLTSDHASVPVYAQMLVRDFFIRRGYSETLERFDAEQRSSSQAESSHSDRGNSTRNQLRVENMVDSFCEMGEASTSGDGARSSLLSSSSAQRSTSKKDGLIERLLQSLIEEDGARALDAIEALPGGFSSGRSYARSVAALREAAQPNYTYQPKFPKFISSPTSVQRMFAIAEAAKPKDEDLAHATRKAAHLRRSAPPVTFERTSMLGASRPAGGEMATELMRQMRLMTVRGGPPDHAKKARAAMASAYSAIQKEKHVPDEMKLRILKRELAVAGANHALDLRSHQLQQHTKKHGVVESRRQVSRAHREPDRRTPCACCSFPFAEKNLHMQVTCKAIVGVQRSWPLHVPVDPKYAEPPRCYDLRWVCAMCAQFFEQAVVESSASPEANPATKTAANSSSAGSTKRHGSLSSKSRLLRLSGRGDQWWLRDGIELGSTVDHKSHGEGTVIRINPDGDQRVHVEFGIGEIHRYKEIAWAKFRMPSDTVNDVTEAGKTKRLGTKSSSPKGGSPTSAELGAAARQGGGSSSSSSSSSSSRRRRMEKTRKRAPKGYVKPSERAAKALERRRRGMRRLAASVLGSPLETDDPYE